MPEGLTWDSPQAACLWVQSAICPPPAYAPTATSPYRLPTHLQLRQEEGIRPTLSPPPPTQLSATPGAPSGISGAAGLRTPKAATPNGRGIRDPRPRPPRQKVESSPPFPWSSNPASLLALEKGKLRKNIPLSTITTIPFCWGGAASIRGGGGLTPRC